MIRLLLADDHAVLRAGLKALLDGQPDMQVVGEAEDAAGCLRAAAQTHPDIVLLDVSMPGLGAAHTTRQLLQAHPNLRVLILTMHEDAAILREVLDAGAAGYVVKRAAESELLNAIRAVQRGDVYVHPAMTRALLESPTPATPRPEPPEGLTPRETEVLRLIALGYTNRQMAVELGISIKTVETHRANITAKLGTRRRVDLVRYAREQGLLDQ
ncbi:MAG: DNA-binding response regulator [Caldilineae bacterium]|nr:MAG: DNA-binding response regulator [Caldilineae bacterium]